ncbi:MAG TPA: universal stress protein [Desulfonatronum sp.]|nr:universal stress protein [Desulfonatronum sp.]
MIKILIAMDESDYAMRAVKYVARYYRPDAAEITLFHVLQDYMPAGYEKLKTVHPVYLQKLQELKSLSVTQRDSIQNFMNIAKDELVSAGFPENHISLIIQDKKIGIARDVILEARGGDYDTIVVGRKGTTAFENFIFGSVTNKILNSIKNRSILIVGTR